MKSNRNKVLIQEEQPSKEQPSKEQPSKESKEQPISASLPWVSIPRRVRGFVFVVGMLGFPIIVASYILVVMNSDVRNLEKSINQLATRIDERPMGLDRTTDFVIYLTDSIKYELLAGIPNLAEEIEWSCKDDRESIVRAMTRADRLIKSFIRPVVRRHKRFAQRFPSIGGNLSAYFSMSAPAIDVSEGDTEAYLSGSTEKDFGESLNALMSNNIGQFGNPAIEKLQIASQEYNPFEALFGGSSEQEGDVEPEPEPEPSVDIKEAESIELMTPDLFIELSEGAVDVAIIALRDQMQEKARLQASEIDK